MALGFMTLGFVSRRCRTALLSIALVPLSAVAGKFMSITPSPAAMGMKSQLT